MRTMILVAVMMLGLPSVGAGAACVPDSLAAYISLGSGGCSIGSATVKDFSVDVLDPLASPIAAGDITVTPFDLGSGFRLDFGVVQNAAAGEFFDALVGYSVAAPALGSARLELTGATASPDGVVTAVEDLCLGDVFATDPTTCFSGTPAGPLIVFEIGDDRELVANLTFGPASFFDVFMELAIDAGLGGSAGVDGVVSTEFTRAAAVPEPSSVLLFGAALLGLARRHRSSRRHRRRPAGDNSGVDRRGRTACEH
jgi:hypothetical protein